MVDRRAWDPFAPAPRRQVATPRPARVELPDDLDDLKKADLVELAEARGLDSDGTRATLIARLRGEE
jgi:hypothetical protein